MRGKLIVIEGSDSSGKETQSKLLIQALREKGINVEKFSFPNYDSPSGKIVGDCYLGRSGNGLFPETAPNVNPKVAALYYAADRKYNIHKIEFLLDNGIHVILDRYVYSNMAHQGCKFNDFESRKKMYEWLDQLEYGLLELPKPEIAVYLRMLPQQAYILKCNRGNEDENERNEAYLEASFNAFEEIAKMYQFKVVECCDQYGIRSKEEISEEVVNYVIEELNKG